MGLGSLIINSFMRLREGNVFRHVSFRVPFILSHPELGSMKLVIGGEVISADFVDCRRFPSILPGLFPPMLLSWQ